MLFNSTSWQEEVVLSIFITMGRPLRKCRGNYTPCTKAVEAIIGRFWLFGSFHNDNTSSWLRGGKSHFGLEKYDFTIAQLSNCYGRNTEHI